MCLCIYIHRGHRTAELNLEEGAITEPEDGQGWQSERRSAALHATDVQGSCDQLFRLGGSGVGFGV